MQIYKKSRLDNCLACILGHFKKLHKSNHKLQTVCSCHVRSTMETSPSTSTSLR